MNRIVDFYFQCHCFAKFLRAALKWVFRNVTINMLLLTKKALLKVVNHFMVNQFQKWLTTKGKLLNNAQKVNWNSLKSLREQKIVFLKALSMTIKLPRRDMIILCMGLMHPQK